MDISIILVDDDQNILTSVSILLENEGYKVTFFTDGAKALNHLNSHEFDLGIFDIKMPRMDGLELLKNVRKKSAMPVIFLTSKDTELDEAEAFLYGADDYITKPFSPKLLIGRIKAVLRRTDPARFSDNTEATKNYVRGDLTLDLDRHMCTWKQNTVTVTVTEFLLLESMVKHIGHIKTRDALMDVVYNDDVYVDDRTIDSHIKRLRKKFRKVDEHFDA
ncbi:MAG: two-component system response regulator ChvI, partial [Alphaproteobacteria bacterium]